MEEGEGEREGGMTQAQLPAPALIALLEHNPSPPGTLGPSPAPKGLARSWEKVSDQIPTLILPFPIPPAPSPLPLSPRFPYPHLNPTIPCSSSTNIPLSGGNPGLMMAWSLIREWNLGACRGWQCQTPPLSPGGNKRLSKENTSYRGVPKATGSNGAKGKQDTVTGNI